MSLAPVPTDDRLLFDRLLRFLLRERSASAQGLSEIWSRPLAARVEDGDAIGGVAVRGWDAEGRLVVHISHDASRFRPGDRLKVGDGAAPAREPELILASHDLDAGSMVLEVPPFDGDRAAVERALAAGGELVLDRAGFDVTDMLLGAVQRAAAGTGPREHGVRELLALRLVSRQDDAEAAAAARSIERLAARGLHLDRAQSAAFIAAWSQQPVQLIQGPPGTGKTWLTALLVAALAWRGERILVTAHTHRAVDNVLLALARIVAETGAPLGLVRVNPRDGFAAEPAARSIALARRAREVRWPTSGGIVVGATLLSALPFSNEARFARVVFDEAAQIPLPHAIGALLAAPRWLLVGDDRQLGPVVVGEHADRAIAGSLFAHLRPAHPPALLDATHRLNTAICRFPSRAFYGGKLLPTAEAAARRFVLRDPTSPLAVVLDPERGAVLVPIAHRGAQRHAPLEVAAAVALAEDLLCRQGVAPEELAIISPFRLQNREITRALAQRLGGRAGLPVIDTVERIQGQERDVVLVSLTCSDPDALRDDAAFFFSPERLCVTLTRARTKLIVLASPALLRTLPQSHAGLVQLDVFHRLFREWETVPLPGACLPS